MAGQGRNGGLALAGQLFLVVAISCVCASPVARETAPAASSRRAEVDLSVVKTALTAKKAVIEKIKNQVETKFKQFLNRTTNQGTSFPLGSNEGVLSGCGNAVPGGQCDPTLGLTQECECTGKTASYNKVVIKALSTDRDDSAEAKAGNVAAIVAQDTDLSSTFASVSGQLDYENKLMYWGSVDGVMTMFPAVMWTRADGTCGRDYDPRRRPWYLSGSNGPKNVIFILDSSGSMQTASRMSMLKTAAKKLVDSMTFADYIGIIDFDDSAKTYLDLTFMAPATSAFRTKVKSFIDGMADEGGTDYYAAFERAFAMADISYDTGYHSKCQTVFVFLTDGAMGQGTRDPREMISTRRARQGSNAAYYQKEFYLIIGFGDDVADVSGEAGTYLKDLACSTGGIFRPVSDNSPDNALLDALMSFSEYFQVTNSVFKRTNVAFSEVYEGTNFKMAMTTASVPAYDKSDPARWKIIGVIGIDVTTCDLEKKIYEANPTIQEAPAYPSESKIPGCKCAASWTYLKSGRSYTSCTVDSWPVPWCATDGCGIKGEEVTDTGYWADCKPWGVRAALEAELLKSGEECPSKLIDQCQIQALRPKDLVCPNLGCANEAEERAKNYFTGLPGAAYRTNTEPNSWSDNGPFTSTLGSRESGDGCEHCKNEKMRPQCSLPEGTCKTGEEPLIHCQCGKSGIPMLSGLDFASAHGHRADTAVGVMVALLSLCLVLARAKV